MATAALEPTARTTRSNNRQTEIVQTAAKLFRERGYAGTTVRDLADAVGVTSGNLYHHFGTKEAILLRVVDEGIRQTVDLIERERALQTDQRAKLRATIRAHLSCLLEGSPETKSIMFYEWWSLSEEGLRSVIERRDQYEKLWDMVIAELEGPATNRHARRVKRLLLIGAMNWTAQWYRPGGGMSVDDIADQLMDTYFSAAR